MSYNINISRPMIPYSNNPIIQRPQGFGSSGSLQQDLLGCLCRIMKKLMSNNCHTDVAPTKSFDKKDCSRPRPCHNPKETHRDFLGGGVLEYEKYEKLKVKMGALGTLAQSQPLTQHHLKNGASGEAGGAGAGGGGCGEH